MTDKEFLAVFLGRYQKALAKIAELEQLKQRIESEAVSIKGVNITTDKVQSNKHTDNVAAPVVSAVSVGPLCGRASPLSSVSCPLLFRVGLCWSCILLTATL